jgi:hypothetical protein
MGREGPRRRAARWLCFAETPHRRSAGVPPAFRRQSGRDARAPRWLCSASTFPPLSDGSSVFDSIGISQIDSFCKFARACASQRRRREDALGTRWLCFARREPAAAAPALTRPKRVSRFPARVGLVSPIRRHRSSRFPAQRAAADVRRRARWVCFAKAHFSVLPPAVTRIAAFADGQSRRRPSTGGDPP